MGQTKAKTPIDVSANEIKTQLVKERLNDIIAKATARSFKVAETYERIKELHKRWESTGAWPETVPLKVKDTLVKDILLTMLKKAEEIPEGDADDLDAIRKAIDFEATGAKHYAKIRDHLNEPHEKNFFDLLAKIENAHYLSLKDTEEFLTDPVSWYQKKERHGLDGA